MPAHFTSREEAEAFLDQAFYGHLGTSYEDRPYVVPVLFVLAEGKIFVHSRSRGQKLDHIKRNSRVCFEVSEPRSLRLAAKACNYSVTYESVIVTGTARLVEDEAAKLKALNYLMEKYAGGEDYEMPGEEDLAGANLCGVTNGVAVIEITIESISGKRNVPAGSGQGS